MKQLNVLKLDIAKFDKTLRDFFIIDIRGKQAFCAAHLKDSCNALNKTQIVRLLYFIQNSQATNPPPPLYTTLNNNQQHNINKPILIICFSSIKAKAMAQSLANDDEFTLIYTDDTIYYLDCGIMEAFESGLEVVESVITLKEMNNEKARSFA